MFLSLCAAVGRGHDDLAPQALLTPFYWVLMSVATWMALGELILRPHHWHKTEHGLHLAEEPRERGRARSPFKAARSSPRRGSTAPRCSSPLVFATQFAFGVWMASRGFRWGDAFYRSTSALFVLHSADPKLADIGFVWMPLPTLLNLPWAALYPVWPDVIASGAASALSSAVCGARRRPSCWYAGRRLGLPRWVCCDLRPARVASTRWCSSTRAPAWARAWALRS